MPIPKPSINKGANEPKISCGVGSYLSHSAKVGISQMTIINKTARSTNGKKLRIPINSFEPRDIKLVSVKLAQFFFAGVRT